MKKRGKIYLALIHHPVMDKNGEKVTSAVTNLDIHDLARLSRTYGLDKIYIITPDEKQKELAVAIMEHWMEGYGASYNQDRKEALETVKILESIDELRNDLNGDAGKTLFVSTSASRIPGSISFKELSKILASDANAVILIGTAHGLASEIFDMSDYTLEPIDMNNGYNHLSVRSAASIIIDRLLN